MLLGVLFVIISGPFCRRVIAAKKSGYNGFSCLFRNISCFFSNIFRSADLQEQTPCKCCSPRVAVTPPDKVDFPCTSQPAHPVHPASVLFKFYDTLQTRNGP